jgi:hypothetical protein
MTPNIWPWGKAVENYLDGFSFFDIGSNRKKYYD